MVNEKDKRLGRNYDRAAWFYEKSAKFYSTNQIRATKKYQLNHIEPGQDVLYLGAGGGEDAIMAAEHGARVTCIDISQGMLDQVRRTLDKKNLDAELICENAFDHERVGHYDVVAANYFLNVFRRDDMAAMMNCTARFVKPGGKYLIADVSLPYGNPLSKVFNWSYLRMGMASFWLIGLVPWHENYDYPAFFEDAGLEFDHAEFFRFAKKGPILFQSIVSTKK